MEWLEHLEFGLSNVARLVKFCVEAISILCIILGLVLTMRMALFPNRDRNPVSFNQLRLHFGMWLQLALEFQLGSDILATTVAPTFDALYKLAITAVIRTFLNYFLNQEFAAERKTEASHLNDSP
jgi:uncharacterized membrane protein